MTKIKVSEATGPVLVWMVAKADGTADDCAYQGGNVWYGRSTSGFAMYRPTMIWSQGGPIIEREMRDHGFDVWRTEDMKECAASYTRGVPSEYVFGPTPLIAAMRCFVASRLGDEVEVPEELLT